ncbi:MAG: hypothetical protein RIC14_12575 [Filomicrobium sp.]
MAISLPNGYSIGVVPTLEGSSGSGFGGELSGGFIIDNTGLSTKQNGIALSLSWSGIPGAIELSAETEFHLMKGWRTETDGFSLQAEGAVFKGSGITINALASLSDNWSFISAALAGNGLNGLIDAPVGSTFHTAYGTDVGFDLELQLSVDGQTLRWMRTQAQDAVGNQPPTTWPYSSFEDFFQDARNRARAAVWGDRVLKDNEEIAPNSFQSVGSDGSFAFDVVDTQTGLVSTINQSFVDDTPHLLRTSLLSELGASLHQDFSFSDLDNVFIPGGLTLQGNDITHQFTDVPPGFTIVELDSPFGPTGPSATFTDYDPFQAFGTTDFSDQTDWPASFGDFEIWYGIQDQDGVITTTIGHREVEAPIDPPPDADPNNPPQLGVTSQYFVREANQTQGDSGPSFNDALYVGGQEAFGGVGDDNGGYTGLITPTTPPDVSGSDGSDTIGGGEGNDTLNDGPRLVVGKQNDDAQLEETAATLASERPLVSGAALGRIFGASLSTLIPTDNVFADIAVSSALQTSLGAVGATFDVVTGYDPINGQQTGISLFDVNGNLNQNFVSNLGLNFTGNAVSGGIGLASGLLANGLADAIGLDDNDFGSALFKTAASSTINYGLKQVAGTALSAAGFSELGSIVAAPSSNFVAGVPFDPGGLVNGIGVNIATMVGTRLANEIVEVKNVGGAIGSSIGSAVGATAGMIAVTAQVASQVVAAIGSTVATFLLPGVGAFIGTALGTLIGNWVGNLFPDEGWGEGTIIIYGGTNRFVEAAYRGNDMDFMRPVRDRMIRTRAIMNELMKAAGGTARRVGITFHNSRVGSDKFSRTEIRGAGAPERRLRSFNSKRLVDEAVTNAARRLDIQGGNAFIAFQLDRNNATTVERLLLQVKWASVWSNLAQMFYSTNNQGPDGADLVDSGVNRLLLAFNPRNFNDAVGTDNDAVWRTAREFGRTLNDETSGVSTRNKDILGINIVRALLTTEVRHMEQLQAQMVAATVFQKNLESVLGNTGGSVAAIPLADLNVGGLFRQTDANGNYTETEDEYDERIRNWGARLTREALQANPDVMLDYSPAAKAAILQATTNSQEGFTRLIAVATYFERLMTSILAPAQNAEPGVTDSAFLAGTFSYDQPDFSTVNADALGRIDDEDDALTAITEEAVRLVKATFEGGLRNADGALIRSHVAIRATDGDDIVRRAIVGFSTDRMDRFEVGLRVATSFSPAFAAMRDRLANVGIEFNSFDLPDLSALTIVEDDTLDPAASDYEDQVAANETEQIIAFVERSVVQALSSGDFAVTDGLSSAVRNSTAVTIGAFDEQVWVAHQFEGIVEAMARLGIDRDSIEIPDFNTAVVNVAAPGENSTEEEQAAYAEAVKVAARDLVGAVQTGATGQAEAVSAFDSHRDVFVELALTTQLRVASVLQYLTHEEKLEIVDNKLQRKAERNGEAISLGTIDFSTVDLTPVVSAPDQGSADLALAEIAERLAFQALRGAQVQDGDPYELSALYSPTVTNYGELIAAIVAGSDLSLYSDNRSIFDAVQILNPDSALTAGWALSAEAGFIHGIRVADFSEFDRGVAKRLVSLEKAAPLADLSVEVRNNGLAIVRDSGSGNPIVLPEITDEAELVEIASDPAAPVTGTGANDLWIAGDGGETFTDATTLADGEASHDVLLGGSGNDAINAGLGNDYVSGGLGNDQLSGGAGDDVLEGGAGDDTLNGGAGNDSYVFSQGFGNDTIQNQDASTETTDTVAFGSGIAADQLWFERLDNDLTVSDLTSNGTITLEDWYVDPAAQVDVFQLADGATLAAGDIEQLISAMAAFNPADFGAAAGSSQQPLPDDVRVAVNTTWQTTG